MNERGTQENDVAERVDPAPQGLPERQGIHIDHQTYWSIVAALITAAAAGVIVYLIVPFGVSIGWSLLIGIPTFRYFSRLKKLIPRPTLCASVMVVIVTTCLILPVSLIGYMIAEQTPEWLAQTEKVLLSVTAYQEREFTEKPAVRRVQRILKRVGMDLTEHVARLTSYISQHLVNAATSVVKNVASVMFELVVTLFILFFLYRDGESLVTSAMAIFPDSQRKMFHYLYEIQSTTTGVVIGTIFTSLMQGVLAGGAYFVAGLPVPVLLGIVTAIAGMVPVVGTTIIWGPLSLILLFNGLYLKGALLAVWGALVVVAFADTVIRPLSASGTTEVHPLAIVLGAIGGAVALGAIGLLLGPIILGMLVIIWRDFTGQKPM